MRINFICSLLILFVTEPALSKEYFNPGLLEIGVNGGVSKDLSSFEEGEQLPGKYHVDIYINNNKVDTQDITFDKISSQSNKLVPCINSRMLNSWGLKIDAQTDKQEKPCFDLDSIQQLTTDFKFSSQRLDINVPQILITHPAKGYISPEQWDDGLNALMLNYSFSGLSTENEQRTNSQYANLRPGFNFNGWRFRNYSTWNNNERNASKWDHVYSYVAHDIHALKGQMIIGDSFTPSSFFDGVPFRGVQMYSDEQMQPDSQQGYAPVVRGIARTNAIVSVIQNGYVIYKMNVAPGSFEINDLYPTSGSGDLTLLIEESDGSEQKTVIPYASVPLLVREGSMQYQLATGKTSFNQLGENQAFSQLSVAYGLPWDITAYAGLQYTNTLYKALMVGTAFNFGNIGALSLDSTLSNTTFNQAHSEDSGRGNSLRLRYNKIFTSTGTNLIMSSYRYSTKNYYSLQDAVMHANNSDDTQNSIYQHMRDKTDLSLSQNIKVGYLSVSYSSSTYYNKQRLTSLGLGYSSNWNAISYGINVNYNKQFMNNSVSTDRQVAVNISVPLDYFSHSTSVNYNMVSSKNNQTSNNVSLNGVALEQQNLSWNIQQNIASGNASANGSVGGSYTGRSGKVNASYSYDATSRNLSYGAEGGILVTRYGAVFSQQMGETNALVYAPGAGNIDVSNQTAVSTNSQGLAVVSNISPYRNNSVALNTENSGNDVELVESDKKVIPTRGSVTLAKYKTSVGYKALFTLLHKRSEPVPFGAIVSIKDSAEPEEHSGLVGNKGLVYMTGLEEQGVLWVRWGKNKDEECYARFTVPRNEIKTVQMATLTCI
jgi:outer membrane usher protein